MKCALEVFEESKKIVADDAYDSIKVLEKICEKEIMPKIEKRLTECKEINNAIFPGDIVATISVGFRTYTYESDIVGCLKYGKTQYATGSNKSSEDVDESNCFSLTALINYLQEKYCYCIELKHIGYFHYGYGELNGFNINIKIPKTFSCIE